MARRSVLISPGDQGDKLEGALSLEADVVVFDLEDGVAPGDKATARETVLDVLSEVDTATDREVLVRLNPPEAGMSEDIEVLGSLSRDDHPDGFVLPKIDGSATIEHQRTKLLDAGFDVGLWCLLESPRGVLDAPAIAEADGVTALIFGGEDYATAVGGERTKAGLELLYARQRTVAAAAAAGIDAIDGITTALTDTERVKSDAQEAKTFGFDGKLAIHPAQLTPINTAFTPSAEQIEWARKVVEAAETTDEGAFRVDDEMIDAPLIKRARSILETADETVDP